MKTVKTVGLAFGMVLALVVGVPTRTFAQSKGGEPTTPPTPTGLEAKTPTNAAPVLLWNDPPLALVVSFEVFRDGAKIGETTASSFTDASLTANGSHVYDVRARNRPLTSIPSKSVTVLFDTIAPSVPTGLAAVGASSQQPLLTWTASTDSGSGVASYNVLRDGVGIGVTSATQYVDSVAVMGTHSYAVAAVDAAGNVSAPCAALSVFYAPVWTADQLRQASFQGCLFGSLVDINSASLTGYSSIAGFEAQIGRTLALEHRFYTIGVDTIPNKADSDDVAAGRIPFDDIEPNDTWANIAKGAQDGPLSDMAAKYAQFGQTVFMCFHHEFDLTPCGTPTEFQRAYAHIVSVFRENGATNVVWALISSNQAYASSSPSDPSTYPINAYYPAPGTNGLSGPIVDWVGTDGFNRDTAKTPWLSFEDLFQNFVHWAATLAGYPTPTGQPPAVIGATGCVENPEATSALDTKPDWFEAVGPALEGPDSQIKAFVYFNSYGTNGNGYPVETSQASLAAFSALGQLPFMNPIPR